MSRRHAHTVAIAGALAPMFTNTPARAESPAETENQPVGTQADGSHGRFDGDLSVAGALGVTVGPRAPRATVDLRFRYLSTAGLFAAYEDGPIVGLDAEPRRALVFGIELRPLFLARWGTGRELGISTVDLLIDSFALELGPVFVQPEGGPFGSRPGLQAGLGLGLPFFGKPSGPFAALHGGVRWSDAALSGGPLDGPSDRALYLTIAFGYEELFGGHVVDIGDRRQARR